MFRAFNFDPTRTIQAVAFLLRREPHRCMNYMRLLKVLYLAEREILAESGRPLTGSPVVAMERGPVLEEVYDLIRGQHSKAAEWSEFFQIHQTYHLELRRDPGSGRLSRFVTNKLEEVARRFENMDEWDMVAFTHTLPEWIKNDPGTSSKRIQVEDVLEAIGRAGDLQTIVKSAKADHQAAAIFNQANQTSSVPTTS